MDSEMRAKNAILRFSPFRIAITIVLALFTLSCSDGGNNGEPQPSQPYHHWMTDQKDVLAHRTLREIAIPGSHDAGMNGYTNCYYGENCNTQTQTKSIKEQLVSGSRYFDIRPTYWRLDNIDTWYAGHFQNTVLGYLGCTGESLDDIYNDVSSYISELPAGSNELIILNFSHCYIIKMVCIGENCVENGFECDESEWQDVRNTVVKKLGQYRVNWGKYPNPVFALFDDRGPGEHVLLRFDADQSAIPQEASQGIYNSDFWPIYNEYANTNDIDVMIRDQESKMQTHTDGVDHQFLLSWTLTLSEGQAIKCDFSGNTTILDLAGEADAALGPKIDGWAVPAGVITQGVFPNILYVDNFDTFATDSAMKLNEMYEKLDPWWVMDWEAVAAPPTVGNADMVDKPFNDVLFFTSTAGVTGRRYHEGTVFWGGGCDSKGTCPMQPFAPPTVTPDYVYGSIYDNIVRWNHNGGSPQRIYHPYLMVMANSQVIPFSGEFWVSAAIPPEGSPCDTPWEGGQNQRSFASLLGFDIQANNIFASEITNARSISPPLLTRTNGNVYVTTLEKIKCDTSGQHPDNPYLHAWKHDGTKIFAISLPYTPEYEKVTYTLQPIDSSQAGDVIYVTGSGYLMAYNALTGDPHFAPIKLGKHISRPVASRDDRVYVTIPETNKLLAFTKEGDKVLDIDTGAQPSDPAYVLWDSGDTPDLPVYAICINIKIDDRGGRTLCYSANGDLIKDALIHGTFDNIRGVTPPIVPFRSGTEPAPLYVWGVESGGAYVMAYEAILQHPRY